VTRAALALFALLAACGGRPAGYADADVAAGATLAADPKVFVLDVRTPEEHARGFLKGATLIPIDQLSARLSDLPADKSRPVLVYCAVGGRSARAAKLLAADGRTAVTNLAGGIVAWTAAGRPVEKPAP